MEILTKKDNCGANAHIGGEEEYGKTPWIEGYSCQINVSLKGINTDLAFSQVLNENDSKDLTSCQCGKPFYSACV